MMPEIKLNSLKGVLGWVELDINWGNTIGSSGKSDIYSHFDFCHLAA